VDMDALTIGGLAVVGVAIILLGIRMFRGS
jgi:hypothetical protein